MSLRTLSTDRDSKSRRVTSRSDETLRRRVASERRPATTTTEKSPTTSSYQTRHHSQEHPSPGLCGTHFVSEGDVPDVRRQQPAQRVRDEERSQSAAYNEETAESVRQPSHRRRSATSPQPYDSGSPRQQPQPITSIHFDSGEIDSTLSARDPDDDGVTWGLDADRCVFETTFPVHDRRRATPRTLQALTDDEDNINDEQDLEEQTDEPFSRQRPRQGLSRWRTLEDIHHSSMDCVAVADDDGSGDTENRWMPASPKQSTSPDHSRRARTKRRSISMPNRSIFGFYVGSDFDSADDSFEYETAEDYRHRNRDDGSGDRRSCSCNGNGIERLELEYGSDDWLEVQREIYRSYGRAEKLFDFPSPRTAFLQSTNAVQSRVNQQPVRTLTTTGAAGQTVVAIKNNEAPRQLDRTAIPTTNTASEQQPNVGETKPNQVPNSSLNSVQTLLLTLFVVILLVGFIYKLTWPSKPPKAQSPPPETSPWSPEFVHTYFEDVLYDSMTIKDNADA